MNENIYTQIGILFILKNSEILTFETMWMNLESIMLSEVSQAQKARHHCMISPLCGISNSQNHKSGE